MALTTLLLVACTGGSEPGDVDAAATGDVTAAAVEPEPDPVPAPLVGTVWLLDTAYGPGPGSDRVPFVVDRNVPAVELVVDQATATVVSEPCTDAIYEVTFTEAGAGAGAAGSFAVTAGGGVECRGSESENANHDVATGGLVGASGYRIDDDRLILIGEEGELIGLVAQGPVEE